jgi:hypothetical protein
MIELVINGLVINQLIISHISPHYYAEAVSLSVITIYLMPNHNEIARKQRQIKNYLYDQKEINSLSKYAMCA